MSKICIVLTAFGFGLSLACDVGNADDAAQQPMARFHFNGNATNTGTQSAEFKLKNTVFNAHALYLNGQYEFGDEENGFRAVCKTPNFSYVAFTVALRFKAEEFAAQRTNILVGGTSYRWFGMYRAESGNLTITLNNHDFAYEVKDAPLVEGKWTVVACGVDLPARKIVAYIDGNKAAEFDLPRDVELQVVGSDVVDRDRNWSFANYSNGNVFHGFVDELIIHNRLLTADEFSAVTRVQQPHDVTVHVNQTPDEKRDAAQKFGTVSGRVMDNAGEFLNNVQVTVTLLGENPSKPRGQFDARTGDDGTYSIIVPIDAEYEYVDVEFIKPGFRATEGIVDNGGVVVSSFVEQGLTTDVSYVMVGSVDHPVQVGEQSPLQNDGPPRIVGRILSPDGKPLPDVAIRVAVPETDMRHVHVGSGHNIFNAKTEADGRYEIQLPDGTRSASVDAMIPGYGSASGSHQMGGAIRNCRFRQVKTANASFVLQGPTLYVRGIVTDDTGARLTGAEVVAIDRNADSYGYISVSQTDEDGEFEIFDYFLSPSIVDGEESKGEIVISHRNCQESVISDVYAIAQNGRATLNIVLHHE